MDNEKAKSGEWLQWLSQQKVILCAGPGGVGKTTTAAALALGASYHGLKTLVMTIDPAKRLADSLGIKRLDYQERRLKAQEWESAGLKPKASLHALMLDTKRTFDGVIRRHASSEEQAKAILDNPLYKHLSNMIGGSQEYMAMEKLYEIQQRGVYDLIVVDTPPSRHALDFLEAPERMKGLIGDSLLKWFLKPSLFVGRAGFRLLDRPLKRIFSSLDKVAGYDFLKDLSEMLLTSAGLLEGFHQRAEKVQALLSHQQTSFILISSPEKIPLQEAYYFYARILKSNQRLGAFIFNRVHEKPLPLGEVLQDLSVKAKKELKALQDLFEQAANKDAAQLKVFHEAIKVHPEWRLSLRQNEEDIHDLKGLWILAQEIFG
ncbi:MAG: ArsA family ATPase [Deltaproteobacteria bacterium]|nr:ArsA family ATPase [Deltaproteobacteria bacterium]